MRSSIKSFTHRLRYNCKSFCNQTCRPLLMIIKNSETSGFILPMGLQPSFIYSQIWPNISVLPDFHLVPPAVQRCTLICRISTHWSGGVRGEGVQRNCIVAIVLAPAWSLLCDKTETTCVLTTNDLIIIHPREFWNVAGYGNGRHELVRPNDL